jgi:hypothetical protein
MSKSKGLKKLTALHKVLQKTYGITYVYTPREAICARSVHEGRQEK